MPLGRIGRSFHGITRRIRGLGGTHGDPTTAPAPGTVDFAQRYAQSVQTPAADEGTLQASATQLPAGTMEGGVSLANLYVTNWQNVDPDHGQRQGNVRIKRDNTNPPNGFDRNLTKKHTAQVEFAPPGGAPTAVFMPWDARGGAVYMELDGGGPDRFYTSLLSGCSFVVAGPPNNPRVYHCGTDGTNPLPFGDVNTGIGWLKLVEHIEGRDGHVAGQLFAVDRHDYLDTPGGADTASLQALHAQLTAAGYANLTLTAFGSVFGIRDAAGNWSFYLQENAVITWDDANGNQQQEVRPVRVIQFHPGYQVLPPTWHP